MRSWHDFHLTGFTVDGVGRQILFDLTWPYETHSDVSRACLRFTGVEDYFLEHDLGSNIVFAFEERPLRGFLEEWAQRFDISAKWGWPKFWRPVRDPERSFVEELDRAFQALTTMGVRCIELSSSYGLSGWILATETSYDPDIDLPVAGCDAILQNSGKQNGAP